MPHIESKFPQKSNIDEISTIIDTLEARKTSYLSRAADITKIIGASMAFIVLLIGAALWATAAHSEVKEWSVDRIHELKVELRAETKEKFVPYHEFTVIRQCVEDLQRQNINIEKKLDRVIENQVNPPRRDQ